MSALRGAAQHRRRAGSRAVRSVRAVTLVAVALAIVSTLVAGCGVPEQRLEPIDRSELPAAIGQPSTTEPEPVPGEVAVARVYWIRGQGLVPESVLFEGGPGIRRLLALLERGPSERDDGLRSAVPQEGQLQVERDDGVVVVELPEVTGPDQLLAVGQLVLTFTSLPGVEQVRLERDGELVEVPLPDGSLVRRPLTAEDYESLVGASSGTNR